MHQSVSAPNRKRRLRPGIRTHPLWQISGAHHREETEQRQIVFAQNHRSPTNNTKARLLCSCAETFVLFFGIDGKDADEQASRRKMPRRNFAIIRNVSAYFESARDFL